MFKSSKGIRARERDCSLIIKDLIWGSWSKIKNLRFLMIKFLQKNKVKFS